MIFGEFLAQETCSYSAKQIGENTNIFDVDKIFAGSMKSAS